MKLGKKIKYIILPILTLLSIFMSSMFYITQKQYMIDHQIASLDNRLDNLLLRTKYQFEYSKDYLRQKIDSKEGTQIVNAVEQNLTLYPSYITQFLNRFIDNSNTSTINSHIVTDFAIFSKNKELVVHVNTQDPFAEAVLKPQTQQILSINADTTHKKISQYYYFNEMDADRRLKFYIVQVFSPYQLTSQKIYDINDSLYYMQAEVNLAFVANELNKLVEQYKGHFQYTININSKLTTELIFNSSPFTLRKANTYHSELQSTLTKVQVTFNQAYFSTTLNSLILKIILVNFLTLALIYFLLLLLINKQIIMPITTLSKSIKNVENMSQFDLPPIDSKDEVSELNESYISLINKINVLANNDALTCLPNRSSFNKQLIRLTNESPTSDAYTAIFYVDLDNFKYVNDNFGHEMGDKLLVTFSERLQKVLRKNPRDNSSFSNGEQCIARLGGDEFVILLTKIPSLIAIESIAQRVCNLFKNGFEVDKDLFNVHASIGIAYSNCEISDPETLLNQADDAMYLAKKDGKNNFKLYTKEVEDKIQFEKEIESTLTNALNNNELHLLFMPAYDTANLNLCGYELLIRCPVLSEINIGPDTFINIAEKSDLILQIDLWVAKQAVIMLKDLSYNNAFTGFFSINVSAKSLRDERFYLYLKELIKTYNIDVTQLELEITETCLLPDDNKAIESLKQLKSLGVLIALDDFGTGYTSFSQLVNYPLDTLKIDRSFVKSIHHVDTSKKPTLNIIYELAKVYQLKVIVEGIETKEDFNYVKELGCDLAQGYYFTKPTTWDVVLEDNQRPLKDS